MIIYSDLIQTGIFIVALIGLCYTIYGFPFYMHKYIIPGIKEQEVFLFFTTIV